MYKHYGMPYMGSKEKILNLIQYIFDREHKKKYFIDLFCGGLCVSHYAVEKTKFNVIANDLNKYNIDLFHEIIFNKAINIKKVWYDFVDRQLFNDVRDNPHKYPNWYVGFVLTIYSFGNSQKAYLFGRDIEDGKKALHQALVFDDWSLIDYDFIASDKVRAMDYKINNYKRILFTQEYKSYIKSKQQLERLQQLQQLERLQQLELYNMDWLELYKLLPVDILKNAIIYCDPPYEATAQYQVGKGFNYNAFWQWFKTCPYSVYVSSYQAPKDIQPLNFELKTQLFNSNGRQKKQENIYWNGKGDYTPTLFDEIYYGTK